MSLEFLDFADFPQISPMDLAYATDRSGLAAFYKYEPELASFQQIIDDKHQDQIDRQLLVSTLSEQFEQMQIDDEQQWNTVRSLGDSHTFTITTAHQPSLFGGPLYFVFKACSAIKLCRLLKDAYPQHDFVPIFMLGGEDHDFEEINHLHVAGRMISWDSGETGAVGRMSTATLQQPLQELLELEVGNPDALPVLKELEAAMTALPTYGLAMQSWLQKMLGPYGLVALSMDSTALKRAAIPFFRRELLERPSEALILATQRQLREAGFGNQAFPRPINLFYLTDHQRLRIEFSDGIYHVIDSDLKFSEAQLLQELEDHPERFSPNVALRPIYQEAILPNLAYVGGGGELAYWLERKSQFEHFGINFPMLVRRDSAFWLSGRNQRKMKKLEITLSALAQRPEQLRQRYVANHSAIDYGIDDQLQSLDVIFDSLSQKAQNIDPTLEPMVRAQQAFHAKRLRHLGGKLRKAEEARHQRVLGQLDELQEQLFPGNGLQERHENFLSFYREEGPRFFEALLEHFNPLDTRFKILLAE